MAVEKYKAKINCHEVKFMSEMETWLITIFFIFILLVNLIDLIKEVKEIKKIKVKLKDRNIRAVVVDFLPYITADIRPILQYTVEGIDKKYIYHFYYNKKNFPIGKEVILHYSEESRLAYDRKDLVKALAYQLFATMFSIFFVWVCIYRIIFYL